MAVNLFGEEIIADVLLRDKFLEPPFSILDSKGGAWQNRKRQWKAKGIKSEVGRDTGLMTFSAGAELDENGLDAYGRKPLTETSIFDPALCELIYRWYCPTGGTILDPFAGGSVRGIVANYLGFKYTGIDIRQEQVDANRDNALEILPVNNQPQWYVGDSNELLEPSKVCNGGWPEFDFVFSCPPYADLEVYSDLPGDLSNKEYVDFIILYRSIIKNSIRLLKPGGYACFVVGDIRDKYGMYRDFVSHTKKAFIDAGAMLYNEAILLQPLGTAMLRAAKVFDAGKKLTKVHENVLIFKKEGLKKEVRAGNVFTGAARAEFDKDDTPAQDVQPSAVEELFKEDAPGVYAGDYIVSWTYDIHEKDGCLFNPRFTGSKSDCENYINQNKP